MSRYLITIQGRRAITFEEWYRWEDHDRLLFRLRRLPCRPGRYLLWYGRNDQRNKIGSLAEILPPISPQKTQIKQIMEMADPNPEKIMTVFPDYYHVVVNRLAP